MPNGKKGDDPFTDILYWKIRRYSSKAETLIAEIVQLGGRAELERTFNLLVPPQLPEFEKSLEELRDRVWREAKQRGWEI
jgi:hypothetical protein